MIFELSEPFFKSIYNVELSFGHWSCSRKLHAENRDHSTVQVSWKWLDHHRLALQSNISFFGTLDYNNNRHCCYGCTFSRNCLHCLKKQIKKYNFFEKKKNLWVFSYHSFRKYDVVLIYPRLQKLRHNPPKFQLFNGTKLMRRRLWFKRFITNVNPWSFVIVERLLDPVRINADVFVKLWVSDRVGFWEELWVDYVLDGDFGGSFSGFWFVLRWHWFLF